MEEVGECGCRERGGIKSILGSSGSFYGPRF